MNEYPRLTLACMPLPAPSTSLGLRTSEELALSPPDGLQSTFYTRCPRRDPRALGVSFQPQVRISSSVFPLERGQGWGRRGPPGGGTHPAGNPPPPPATVPPPEAAADPAPTYPLHIPAPRGSRASVPRAAAATAAAAAAISPRRPRPQPTPPRARRATPPPVSPARSLPVCAALACAPVPGPAATLPSAGHVAEGWPEDTCPAPPLRRPTRSSRALPAQPAPGRPPGTVRRPAWGRSRSPSCRDPRDAPMLQLPSRHPPAQGSSAQHPPRATPAQEPTMAPGSQLPDSSRTVTEGRQTPSHPLTRPSGHHSFPGLPALRQSLRHILPREKGGDPQTSVLCPPGSLS